MAPSANLELDHVLIAVADLESGARDFEKRYGLGSVPGGRHAGWGTANRIVPLGETYLELIAVVDEAEAAQSEFGNWVGHANPGQPLGWAVRTDGLDEVAGRLGLTVSANSRATDDGRVLRWRLAGVERAAAEPAIPILVEWGEGTPHPGRIPVSHRAGPMAITELHLDGDADRVATWLGTHELPISVGSGGPALTAIVLSGVAGEIVIEDAGSP